MNLNELESEIKGLLTFIEDSIAKIGNASIGLQARIYDIVRLELLKFEQTDGVFVTEQDLRKRLISLEDKIFAILNNESWDVTIVEYLNTLQTIQDRNVAMQLSYNDLKVNTRLLSPARLYIYEQAKYALTTAVAPQYVEPVKYLVMQQVTSGNTITESLKMLQRWNEGELTNGKYTNKILTPNLQKYATQIARDTSYSVDRTINSIIKERYGLGKFIYVGGVIEDSRPLCRYLVGLRRKIGFDELPELIQQFPDGLIAGTDEKNFTQNCGGYNCRHRVMAVKG